MSNAGHEAGAGDSHRRPARSDLRDAIGWVVLGLATLIASIRMDRLEQQNINPVTIPGLLPGLLGIAMMLLGLVLGLRSWRRGALHEPVPAPGPMAREQRKRVVVATALCLGYAVVLVGHGLPFWIASSIYVTASILIFQRMSPDPAERKLSQRVIVKALAIGVISSVVVWLVFEHLFLVRLP